MLAPLSLLYPPNLNYIKFCKKMKLSMIGPVEVQLIAPVKPSSSVPCVYLKGQGPWRMGQREGLDHIQFVPSLAVCQGVLGLQWYGVGW